MILGLRIELGKNVCAPGVADQNPIFFAVRVLNHLSNSKPLQVQHPILGIACSQVRKVGPVAHF